VRTTYRVLAILIPVLVAVQAAAIAAGTFGVLNTVDDGTPFTESSDPNLGQVVHSAGAMAIALVALLLLIVSLFAKIDGGVKWAALVFLSVVFQWVIAIFSFGVPALGALHGLNAFVMFGLGSSAAAAAGRSMRSPASPPASAQGVSV
jgi:hypothetical protein